MKNVVLALEPLSTFEVVNHDWKWLN